MNISICHGHHTAIICLITHNIVWCWGLFQSYRPNLRRLCFVHVLRHKLFWVILKLSITVYSPFISNLLFRLYVTAKIVNVIDVSVNPNLSIIYHPQCPECNTFILFQYYYSLTPKLCCQLTLILSLLTIVICQEIILHMKPVKMGLQIIY